MVRMKMNILIPLLFIIFGMVGTGCTVLFGIAGGSGSGKTTVANVILERVGADRIAYLPHDAYYKDLRALPTQQRTEVNFDHPNSLETELLIQHVEQLKNAERIYLPVYDFTTHTRTERTIPIESQPDFLRVPVEGII